MFCRKVLIVLSAVFSLNGAVAEQSRSESVCQAHLAVDTTENVIRGGGDSDDGWAMARKQDEFNGLINCKQLINGLLIKKDVSDKQKQAVHTVEPDIVPALEMSVANRCAGWNELLVMADQGTVVSSCGTSFMGISISKKFVFPWSLGSRCGSVDMP